MKKSVRIRKAQPGETPGYKNKTKQFLQKAQQGMSMTSQGMNNTMMANPAVKNAYNEAYIDIKYDTPPDTVYAKLIYKYGFDDNTALTIVSTVLNQLIEQGEINPDILNSSKSSQQQTQQIPEETQQMVDDPNTVAENEEEQALAMSSDGYYDMQEAMNNDNSHIDAYAQEEETDESFGGYYDDGGNVEEEYYPEDEIINTEEVVGQYDTPGNLRAKKPFSINDLIAVTPGMQGQETFPDISYYLGDYKPIGNSWEGGNWLPSSQGGGSVSRGLKWALSPLNSFSKKGYNIVNRNVPIQNMSKFSRMFPISTLAGIGMQKIPWAGQKFFTPEPQTHITKNAFALSDVLNGKEPPVGVFSSNENYKINPDESLQVNAITLKTRDIAKIMEAAMSGRSSFTLADLDTEAAIDGHIGGVYTLDSKISTGQDDEGRFFFDISKTFKPGERTAFGIVPNDSKPVSFRNRFYMNPNEQPWDPNAGEFKVFDQLGNELTSGQTTAFGVTRPIVPSLTQGIYRGFMNDPTSGVLGRTTSSLPGTMFQREEITGVPPVPYKDAGFRRQVGRVLENFGLNAFTWPSAVIGGLSGNSTLVNPLRTRAQNITKIDYPSLGYTHPGFKSLGNPLLDVNYAEDIRRLSNYPRKLGFRGIGTLGLGYYIGDSIYDAYNYPCQCTDDSAPNYMELDAFGKCPCGTTLGSDKRLDQDAIISEPNINEQNLNPDTMQWMMDNNIEPTIENYYLYNRKNPDVWQELPPDDRKKGGSISKKQFTKKLLALYEDGGQTDEYIGQGSRFDNVGKNIKDTFINNIKSTGNSALANEIHNNVKKSGDPKLMELLTQTKMDQGNASNNLTMKNANLGMSVNDNNTPSWYTGYKNNRTSPRAYRNMFRDIGKMITKDNINTPNYIGRSYVDSDLGYDPMSFNIYNTPIIDPYEQEQIIAPEDSREIIQLFNNVEDNTPLYGDPGIPSQVQADKAEQINNMNGMMQFMKGSLLPNFNNVSDPFLDDTDNDNIMDLFINSSNKIPEMVNMQKGGYVNMNTENPITKFTSGGFEIPKAQEGEIIECSPGYVYSDAYKKCIPLMRYNYNFVPGRTTSGGLFRTLAPFNPIFGRKIKIKNYPYFINNGMPYMGSLQGMTPVATDVYKTGIFGRPKNFITYLDPTGQGLSPEVIESIRDGRSDTRKRRKDRDNNMITNVIENVDETIDDFKENRRERRYSKYLDDRFGKDYWYGDRGDDPYKYHADDMLGMGIRGRRSQKQLDKLYAWEDRQRFKEARKEGRLENRKQRQLDKEESKRFRDARRALKTPKRQFAPGGFIGDDLMGDQSNYVGNANMGPGSTWGNMDFFNTNQNITNPDVEAFNNDPMNNMVTEPGGNLDNCTEEQKRDTTSECYCSPEARQNPQDTRCYDAGLIGVEFKANKSVVDPEAGVNVFNAAMRGGLGLIKRAKDAKYQNKMILDNSDPMNLYANATTTDRGDWQDFGSKSGMYKYDQEGINDLSDFKTSQYGGYMQNGGGTHKMFNGLNMRNSDHKYYDEGDEVYMTREEIEQYLANGGQVEYL
jgi:hypothetical protein